jgi:hypothetical protein
MLFYTTKTMKSLSSIGDSFMAKLLEIFLPLSDASHSPEKREKRIHVRL